ncbi:MAG: septal ring lytic transglycosylase RlpA family protein [Acidobacteria bacterium]|nr:septal ring lytic transglycosylase RlpA family protein [Acidobacteriota bacterium]MBI3280573.1 septal ring lytic transglycosylase RlpA family protein [Acidobacteriota bacterium]
MVSKRKRAALAFLAAAVALLSFGCGRPKRVRLPAPPRIGDTEHGVASWYGHPYHGRRAANGEIYDMEKFTAAHRTLPFDTWVRVRNLANERTVDVRIQDRGPFVDGRIIDLSHAAAREIGLIGPGIARVRLTVIEPPEEIRSADRFGVQVGAFQDRTRADGVRENMRQRFGSARLVERPGSPQVWRVIVGDEETIAAAAALAAGIREAGGPAFVVRLDNPVANR